MSIGLRARWLVQHGAPRAYMAARARMGDPLGRLVANHGRTADPYPWMEEIRARGPLVRTSMVWVSTDHAVCRETLRDNRFGTTAPADNELPAPLRLLLQKTDPQVANPIEPPAMVVMDAPDHTRYRSLVSQSFTPRAIDALSHRVDQVTAELIDGLAARPAPELIADLASRLPVAMIAEILCLPAETHPRLLQWGRCGAPLLDIGIGWKLYRHAIDGLRSIDDFLGEHRRQMRSDASADNPFSRLFTDTGLTDREFVANATLVIGAGFETTMNLIGNGIVQLLRHPDQLARLRDEPELWPNAIEECLRYESPVQMIARTAQSDVEVAGRKVKTGDIVALLIGGANRDPKVFTDPNDFDVTRANAREHLAFASGPHHCLGAALARIEGVAALRSLFEAYPDLRLDEPPRRRGLVNLYGYERLPVTLGSRRSVPA